MSGYMNVEQLLGRTFARVGVDGGRMVFMSPDDGGAEVTVGWPAGETAKTVLEVVGRINALIGNPVLEAARSDLSAAPIGGSAPVCWTFVKLGTLAGSVQLRFLGGLDTPVSFPTITEQAA